MDRTSDRAWAPRRHPALTHQTNPTAAKAAGARWDPAEQLWYVLDPASPAVARWPLSTS
ncbi:MAG: DUF5710 domain-containing protein [Clostridia bacterium]